MLFSLLKKDIKFDLIPIAIAAFIGMSNMVFANALEILKEIDQPFQDSVFLQFPYEKYAASVELLDISSLQQDHRMLEKNGYNGNVFLRKYLSFVLNQDSFWVDRPRLVFDLLELGETFRIASSLLKDSTFLYISLSDKVFEKIASFVQGGIEEGRLDPDDKHVITWITILARNKYSVPLPVSDIEKGFFHLDAGNYGYILKRVWTDHSGKLLMLILAFVVFNGILITICSKLFCNRFSNLHSIRSK